MFVVSGSNEKAKRKSDILLHELYYEMGDVLCLFDVWCIIV